MGLISLEENTVTIQIPNIQIPETFSVWYFNAPLPFKYRTLLSNIWMANNLNTRPFNDQTTLLQPFEYSSSLLFWSPLYSCLRLQSRNTNGLSSLPRNNTEQNKFDNIMQLNNDTTNLAGGFGNSLNDLCIESAKSRVT